jgi:hypothetical protein
MFLNGRTSDSARSRNAWDHDATPHDISAVMRCGPEKLVALRPTDVGSANRLAGPRDRAVNLLAVVGQGDRLRALEGGRRARVARPAYGSAVAL